MSRLSGTAAGSSTPDLAQHDDEDDRDAEEEDDLAAEPVSQPVTDTLTPSPGPVYHPVNADTASTTPASSPSRSPMPSSPRSKRESPRRSRSWKCHRGHSMEHRAVGVAPLHFVPWHRQTREVGVRRRPRRRPRGRSGHRAAPPGAPEGADRAPQAHAARRDPVLARAPRSSSSRASRCRHDLARDPDLFGL